MKLIVFFRVYGLPLLFAALLPFTIGSNSDGALIYAHAVIGLCSLFLAFITDKRYIQEFKLTGDQLMIIYVTQFLRTKKDQFDLAGITELRIDNMNKLAFLWPPYLDLTIGTSKFEYVVFRNDLYHKIKNQLALPV